MPVITTKTTYLEMLANPEAEISAPRSGLAVSRIHLPSVEYYRRLYRDVGSDYHWVDRLVMPDRELQEIILDERVEIFVLTVADDAVGFSELDRRRSDEIELAYFGLLPHATGRQLGKYLLNWTLRQAWSYSPRRVWVHTCDLDHPAALPNYLKAGFQVYDEVIIEQTIPEEQP